jgi:DNA-binding Lrp family transcriptional regulator
VAPTLVAVDETGQRIIAELQVNGRASWTEIAEREGISVAAVARRGQQLLASGAIRIGVLPRHSILQDQGGLSDIRIVCAPGKQFEVAEALIDVPNLRFLALVTGKYDLIGELSSRIDGGAHVRQIQAIQGIPGVERCVSNPHMHAYKWSQRWLRQTLGDHLPEPAPEREPCDGAHIDDVDRQIIDAMANDGRISLRAVAERLSLNESTVRRRFEILTNCGCLEVITLVSAHAVGYEAETLLDVFVEPKMLGQVADQLSTFDGVRYIAASLSSPALFCEVILPDAGKLHSFLTEDLAWMDGVRSWEAGTELLTFKRGFLETPWWRRAAGREID